jgi:hypothetical protein
MKRLSLSVDDLPCLGSIKAYLLARELREVPRASGWGIA